MKPILKIVAICVICAATLMSGCMEEYTHRTMIDTTVHIEAGGAYYYGGNGEAGNSSHTFRYEISSPSPVDVRIVQSRDDFELAWAGEYYTHYPNFASDNVYKVIDTVTIPEHGGVMVMNNNYNAIPLSVKVEYVGQLAQALDELNEPRRE